MTSPASPPVVVGVDGSPIAVDAVRWAALRAARDRRPLRLVHAYELPVGFPTGVTEEESILDAMRRQGRQWLADAAATAAAAAPDVPVETALAGGDAVAALLRESAAASVLVLGNRGHNVLTGLLTGSTAEAVVGRAACPVVLTRDSADATTGPVVVGVDGTEASTAAVAFAFAEASAWQTPLVAVHAWSESAFELTLAGDRASLDLARHRTQAAETLAERVAGWQEKYPDVRVERVLTHDRPGRALREHARTARLMVVGRRGRGGFPGLLMGSTSQYMVHHATCPVAVVRTETTG